MSRARELAKVGGKNQQVISGLSSHVGVSTFLSNVHMFANLDVGGNVTVTGTTTFNGGTLTLGDANTDNIVFGGEVDSNIIPDDDGSYDLGSSSKEWKDLYIDGTAHIDTLDVDLNAGIDGNLTLTGNADFNGDLDVDGTTNLDAVDIDGAVDMASSLTLAGNADFNGNLDVDGTTNLDATNVVGTLTVTGDIAADNVTVNGNTVSTSTGGLTLDSTGGTVTVADALNVTGGTTTTSLNANGDVNLGDATSDTITAVGRFDSDLVPSTDDARDIGASGLEWKDLYLDGTAQVDMLTVDADASVAGNFTLEGGLDARGNVDLGNATSDTITATGRFDSDLLPSTDGARDLGSSTLEWQDLYIDGTANIDSLVADTADINGGTVDGAAIGGNSASTGAFTTISASGNVDFNGNLDVDGTSNLDAVDIDGAVDMASTLTLAGNADFNGDLDVDGTTNLDAVDIDGAVDMASTLTLAGNADFNGDLDVDGTTNLDGTNIAGTLAVSGAATVDNLSLNGNTVTTSSGNLTIDSAGGTTTIADNAIISGNLTVNGTTTTINSTTVAIDDKNFQVATGAADDAAANGAGLTVDSGDGDKTINFEATGDNWGFSENINLASGKVLKVNNTQILSASALSSSVTVPNGSIPNSGVTAATYGSSTAIPILTVDAKGFVTSATTTAVDSTTIENGSASVAVASNGPITSTGNHDFTAGIDVTGNITVSGTVDGRDVASDGSKLDGIESGATADQSASEILTLIKTVDGSGSGLDADTLDGISSASFLRSDASDTFTGTLTVSGNILPNANGTRDLGASGTRWANVYTSDIDLNNQAKGGNTIDGSWGSYLIEEGADDLFLKNRRTGKTYKFMLQEV